jgi:hypothetical protein
MATTPEADDVTHSVSESADKIVFKCKTTRGEGTRDQDKGDLKVKGNDPDDVARRVAETLDALEREGVHEKLRAMQPDGDSE